MATPQARIVAEHGSFRLIESAGRYAVVECRNDKVYSAHSEAGDRPAAADTPEGMAAVVRPEDWTDVRAARALYEDLIRRGEELARTIW